MKNEIQVQYAGAVSKYQTDKSEAEIHAEIFKALEDKTAWVEPGGTLIGYMVLANAKVSVLARKEQA